ncbi:hypothetical protein [Saccharothrix yanglingensis]|uniref:hypothetical protein n=1 Tax=Saccharothrix yanglingensis TaxID=659496 RepID=UPI0027D2B381|nr:hypothetical protein [Saccharothrix yanglingensis]
MDPVVPRYGAGSLSDVVPSPPAGLGVPGAVDVLGLAGPARVCVLLVDGLGRELLRDHPADAPFLSSLSGPPITAGAGRPGVGRGGGDGLVRTRAEPTSSGLVGQHGSLTAAEQHVPVLVASGGG